MKKRTAKILASLCAAVLAMGVLAGCGSGSGSSNAGSGTEAAAGSGSEGAAETAEAGTPLVVGYSHFNSKFSPFFAETAYDQDVATMTQLGLLASDRTGAIVYKGIEGETIAYNGTDYTYYGPADLVVTENEDGTVFYDFTLRDDLTFSDGEKLTVDDIIFSMYVLCDPTYDGSSTLYSQPIQGMAEYRSGMETLFNLMVKAGRDNTDFTNWTEEQQKALWEDIDQAGAAFAQSIADYCIANGYNAEGDSIAKCAANWGYELPEDADAKGFWDAMVEAYEGDIMACSDTENAGTGLTGFMNDYDSYTIGVKTGDSAANISGIQKIDDTHLRVVASEVDATMIYQLSLNIAPMHYYGDASLYDYDNNSFGFPKGDLSSVRAKTTQPMGAGPYKFDKYENGVVYFTANDSYFQGAPKTKSVQFREMSDADKLNSVTTGTADITDPSINKDAVAAIKAANSNGDIVGDKITTDLVDNLGYGYIGMNSHNVAVGDDPASDASKNLRRAIATILCVYRDVAIDTYYGELADVINYPISNTSWAAPQPADDGYQIAFSTDVEGNPIYTSEMTAEEKSAAAEKAALGFFEAAGYTVADGKVTAAPEGAKMEFEAWIPADGSGDHPSFMILDEASKSFANIGINFTIKDLTNSSDLWTALEAGQVDIWCAAWGATVDPDMYQIYYSDVANGGAEAGGSNYMYKIEDAELDEMILAARKSVDQSYRKSVYKACLDKIIDWACEIPVYQRQNAIIFSTERVNMDTVTPDITTFYGWLNEIQNIEMN